MSVNSLYTLFATDKAMEQKGIWVNYGAVRFLIARSGGANQKFANVFKELSKPYRRQIEQEQLSEEVSERLMAEAYARSVILRWQSQDASGAWIDTIPNKEGTGQLEFTVENVMQVLHDLPELFADIKVMAAKASNYRTEGVADDAGN